MNDTDVIDAEVINRAIVPATPTAIFGTSEPVEVLARAQAVAVALKAVVLKAGLIKNIHGRDYPLCEAWTTLGSMVGVFPVLEWTRPVEDGWEARVEARTLTGAVVGAAEAQCTRGEKSWSSRDDFALRSMAQTRATAKALRMPLGFVMTLGGFEATPAEEMTFDSKARAGAPSRPPVCQQHGAMAFRRAGTSKAGKAYPAFWACENRECKESVDAVAWSDHLNNEAQPKATDAPDLDDLPQE